MCDLNYLQQSFTKLYCNTEYEEIEQEQRAESSEVDSWHICLTVTIHITHCWDLFKITKTKTTVILFLAIV